MALQDERSRLNAADSEAEAVATVRHMVDALWNRRDIAVADDLFADDFDNGPARPSGPAFVKQWHLSTAASFPDFRYEITRSSPTGAVALHSTTGLHKGSIRASARVEPSTVDELDS